MNEIKRFLTVMTTYNGSLPSKLLCCGETVYQFLPHYRWRGRRQRGRGCWRITQVVLLYRNVQNANVKKIFFLNSQHSVNLFPIYLIVAADLIDELGVVVWHPVQWRTAKRTRELVLSVQIPTAIRKEVCEVHTNQGLHEGQQGQLL